MPKQIFRKVALERLSSPEQLDTLMHLTSSRGWLALLALGGLIVSAIIWGFLGSIPEKVYGQGMLLKTSGIFNVVTSSAGPVTAINVEVGDSIVSGQVVAWISQPQLLEKIEQTREKLKDLENQYKIIVRYSRKDIELQTDLIAQTRRDLRQENQDLKRQLQWQKKTLENQKELLKKGLITRQTLLETQAKIDSIAQQINSNKNSLSETFDKELELKNQRQQQIINSQESIDIARSEMESLQNQLKLSGRVIAPYSGLVVAVMQDEGNTVNIGDPILRLELSGKTAGELEAVIYVGAADGKKIEQGKQAQVSPSTVKQEEYGFMQGLVTSVGEFPASAQSMYRVLQDEALVKTLSAGGPPILTRVILIPDPYTVSGYRWSSPKGPPLKIQSGTLCTASITVSEQAPIALVIPLFKKYVLGVGQNQNGE
jgi:HlyD family secretion protein